MDHGPNVFPGNATFTGDSVNYIDPSTGFFVVAYSTSPGMAVNMENIGAKYAVTGSGRDFTLYVRAYWPQVAVTDGTWVPPAVQKKLIFSIQRAGCSVPITTQYF